MGAPMGVAVLNFVEITTGQGGNGESQSAASGSASLRILCGRLHQGASIRGGGGCSSAARLSTPHGPVGTAASNTMAVVFNGSRDRSRETAERAAVSRRTYSSGTVRDVSRSSDTGSPGRSTATGWLSKPTPWAYGKRDMISNRRGVNTWMVMYVAYLADVSSKTTRLPHALVPTID
jgi:hypothetical protein